MDSSGEEVPGLTPRMVPAQAGKDGGGLRGLFQGKDNIPGYCSFQLVNLNRKNREACREESRRSLCFAFR